MMTASQMPSPEARSRSILQVDASVIDIQRYLEMFMRRRFLIIGVFVGLFALVAGLTLSAPPKYTATAQIQAVMHQRNTADLLPGEAAGDSALADASKLDTEVGILQSRAIAVGVLKTMEPEPAEPVRAGGLGLRKFIGGLIAQIPWPRRAPPPGSELDEAVASLEKNLKVEREGTSYIIDVSFTAKDQVWAAKVANAFVRVYLAQKSAANIQTTDQANSWLNDTLAELGKEVVAADAAVAAYRVEHHLERAGASTTNEETVSAIDQQLVTARAEQAEAEARFNTAKQQLAAGSSGDDVGEALASPVVQQLRSQRAQVSQNLVDLRARYGAKNPEILKTVQLLSNIDLEIHTEIQRIISNLAAQAQVTRQRVASLQNSLDRAGGAVASNDVASVKLDELLRNQDAARTTYQGYLSRYKQTSAQEGIPQNEARVLAAAATPDQPSSPNIPKSLAIAFAVGVMGALGTMVGADAFQRGFSDPDEIARVLGVPGLASIPTLSSTLHGPGPVSSPAKYVMEKPLSLFAESFRTLRTSLLSIRVEGGAVKVVLITSAVPREGKTTTSICLGRVSARGDAKTVIVDCDLRRRSLDEFLDRKAEVGLLEVLDGKASLEAALVRDAASGAFILPLGTMTAPHRDVFNSPNMDRLLDRLRERFDLVLLDAPPVLTLADARVLAQKADVTLLLARWRTTPKGAVEAAMLELAAVGAVLAGIALTQVDLRQERKPRYGGGYYDSSYEGYFGN
jgi:capsular exopolysaccharide synthesis family protein